MYAKHTIGKRLVAVFVTLAMIIGFVPAYATPAYAADREIVTVEKMRPEGITIDLFDYWLTTQEAPDNVTQTQDVNSGINAAHVLKFGQGGSGINGYTNGAKPHEGIVKNTLTNGYPVLSQNSETLNYLFDAQTFDGKAAYTDVGGLLMQDEKGYYSYDSTKNFASLNTTTNEFTLYAAPAVSGGGVSAAGGNGMFFPFNTADEVFTGNGTWVSSTNPDINHYFGLHMTTSFQQTKDGVSPSDNNTPVTFSFSGDDDVWIFIDDVLVADLGGIHDACSVEINFQTGAIYVYKDANKSGTFDSGDEKYNAGNVDNLNEMFIKAGKESTVDWSGATFKDETYHTLDFFYLERGNVNSNMKMKYNLKTVPESDLVKVDQDGEPVANAEFELYETGAGYIDTTTNASNLVATGTTDANGVFTFKKPDGDVLPLSQLKSNGHYLLKETNVPKGYRIGTEPIKLYVKSAGGKNLLLSDNEWDTGAYAMPKVRVSALTNGSGKIQGHDVNDGLIVAAVFKGDDVQYGTTNPDNLSLVY